MGCGINYKLSRDREKLLAQIAENGVVLSEFNPQLSPNVSTFAVRNRIIAGLCNGVVVVEAKEKSGTIITSNYAVRYGRDVFAFFYSNGVNNSLGCIKLIRDGAIPIERACDVFNKYLAIKL